MSVQVGNVNSRLVRTESNFDPQSGRTFTLIYEGDETSIKKQEANFVADGYRTWISQIEGAKWQLRVNQPDTETTPDEAVDRYEIATEYVSESIWGNPKIVKLFLNPGESITASVLYERIAESRKNIESAIDSGKAPTLGTGLTLNETKVMKLVMMSTDSYETERFVLKRTRTIAYESANRAVIQKVPRIYTSTSLVGAFGIPDGISNLISNIAGALDAAPEYMAWGWKQRQNTQTFLSNTSKVEEVQDWVFALWSTLLYDVS